jgi:hypothetical protein
MTFSFPEDFCTILVKNILLFASRIDGSREHKEQVGETIQVFKRWFEDMFDLHQCDHMPLSSPYNRTAYMERCRRFITAA